MTLCMEYYMKRINSKKLTTICGYPVGYIASKVEKWCDDNDYTLIGLDENKFKYEDEDGLWMQRNYLGIID